MPPRAYDKAQAHDDLYAEQSEMDALLLEDMERYKERIGSDGWCTFGDIEPISRFP